MRIPLVNLLVKSPVPQVNQMMHRVEACAARVPELIDRLMKNDYAAVEQIAEEISRLESEVDNIKDEIRLKIPVRLFLPVDRRDLLRLISQIDGIADCAEDIAVLLTLRRVEVPDRLKPILPTFVDRVTDVLRAARALMDAYEELVTASFGGKAAERVLAEIRNVEHLEHEADKLQSQCAKALFSVDDDLSAASIFIWTKVLTKIGDMANHAKHIADQFRLFVAS